MEKKEDPNAVMKDFLKAFLIPTIVIKMFLLYFGLHYADFPGEGYGYGIVACIVALIIMMGRFLWKYKDTEDP
jgi:hypothetical protein